MLKKKNPLYDSNQIESEINPKFVARDILKPETLLANMLGVDSLLEVKTKNPIVKLNLSSLPIIGDNLHNYKLYCEIVQQFPYIKRLLEGLFKLNVEFGIYSIYVQQEDFCNQITFYTNQYFQVYFDNKELIDMCNDYRVFCQMPGNEKYKISISINLYKHED